MKRLLVAAALFGAMTVSAIGDRAAGGHRQARQHQGRAGAELSADGVPRSRHQRAVRLRHRSRRGDRPQARRQDRMAGDQLCRVHAVDFDGPGGCHPVRLHGLCEPSRHCLLRRLSRAAVRSSSCSNRARPSSRTRPRSAARRSAPAAGPCFRRRSRRGARRIAAAIRSSSSAPTARPMRAPSSGRAASTPPCRATRRCPT